MDMRKDVSSDAPWTDLCDANPVPKGINAQLARKHADGGFGRVVRRVPTEVIDAGDRRDIDDVTAISRNHTGNDETT
jgi:hypothetical protein